MKQTRSILFFLLLGLLVLLAAWTWGPSIHRLLVEIKGTLGSLGIWGFVIFAGLFVVLTSLAVPDSVLSVAAGAVFGFVGGLAIVLASVVVARTVQYTLAQRFLKKRVRAYLESRPRLASVTKAVLRDQFRLQLLVRLTPLSATGVSYIFGAMGVRLGAFLFALAGAIPFYVVMVYVGVEGAHIAEVIVRSDDSATAMDYLQMAGAGAGLVVLVLVTRTALRAINAASDEAESASAPEDTATSGTASPD